MYPQYMCILPIYEIDILCIGISEIYFQLEWGVDVSSVYVHSAICDILCDVMVFQRSIVDWSREDRCILSICAFCYM